MHRRTQEGRQTRGGTRRPGAALPERTPPTAHSTTVCEAEDGTMAINEDHARNHKRVRLRALVCHDRLRLRRKLYVEQYTKLRWPLTAARTMTRAWAPSKATLRRCTIIVRAGTAWANIETTACSLSERPATHLPLRHRQWPPTNARASESRTTRSPRPDNPSHPAPPAN